MHSQSEVTTELFDINDCNIGSDFKEQGGWQSANKQRSFSKLGYAFQFDDIVNETKDIQDFEFEFKIREPREETSSGSILTVRQPEPSIVCLSGWIAKQSGARIFGVNLYQDWKSNWMSVTLKSGSLFLCRFESEASTLPIKTVQLGLHECAIRLPDIDAAGRFCFSVSAVGKSRPMLLCSSSLKQAEQWTSVLNSIAEDLRHSH